MQILTKTTMQLFKGMSNHKNHTSIGKVKFGEAEHGQEFAVRTMTKKSTKINQTRFFLIILFKSIVPMAVL